jgi:hypothetical protein
MSGTVASIVNELLTELNFKRKGSCWYKDYNEVAQLVGLQKSEWGKEHYLNLGIWVNKIERRKFPKIPECHIQCRIDTISDHADDIQRALDEEDSWKMDV